MYIYTNEIKKKKNQICIRHMELTLPRVWGLVMLGGVDATSHTSNVEDISVRERSKTQEISCQGFIIVSSGTVIGGGCFRHGIATSTTKSVLKRSPFKG